MTVKSFVLNRCRCKFRWGSAATCSTKSQACTMNFSTKGLPIHLSSFMFLLQVPRHRLRITKETIQPNNKAPRRTLLFGFFVSFVMTLSAERPKHLQTDVLRIPEQHVLSFLSIGDWSLSLENCFQILKSLVRVCIKLIKRPNIRKCYLFYTSTLSTRHVERWTACTCWNSSIGILYWIGSLDPK